MRRWGRLDASTHRSYPPPRWLRLAVLPAVIAALIVGAAPAAAAYQGTVDVNHTAFAAGCLGFDDPYPHKMVTAAAAAYARLGYASTTYFGAGFTRATTLARTRADYGFYVHSHGDLYYNPADGRYYSGFRDDSGRCSGSVVYSKDILAARAGRQSNLVFMSTCHLGDPATSMPGAFAIPKTKNYSALTEPEFYVGYLGSAWDNDEWVFEQAFWNASAAGRTMGQSFDLAMLAPVNHAAFAADWWGVYQWKGWAGPIGQCQRCS